MTAPTRASQGTVSLDDPSLYINRELSLLAFQRRVLEEAQDPTNPLLERIKFLAAKHGLDAAALTGGAMSRAELAQRLQIEA